MTEPSGKPWYREGLHFGCTRCGDCCRGEPGYVWVTDAEIGAIAAELEMLPEQCSALYVRQVGVRYSLKERPDGDCVLYEDGCKVYRVRPLQCRTFPFWRENVRSKRAWKAVSQVCPGLDRGKLYIAQEIEAALGAGPDDLFSGKAVQIR